MDEREPERVLSLWKKIRQHGVQPVLEDSGNKGYHFWILFETPIPLGAARAIGAFFGNGHEVFPKQDRFPEGGMGSLIKLPLGVHLASGRRSQFVGEDLSPYVRQIGYLHKVERQNGASLFESLVGGRGGEGSISRTAPPQARALKPCIRELLARGTAEGQRNRVGHAIACELRRLGVDIREARGALKTWNLRNTPPLSLHELQSILQSAYNHAYEYGCAEGGFLRTIAGCDPALCLFWRSRDGESGALDVSPADPGAGSPKIAPAP